MENQAGRDGFPFEHWQFGGDTLTISADNSSETLSPGEPLSLSIHGRGRTTSPTGCTFNGAACPTLRVRLQSPQPRQEQQPLQQPAPQGQQTSQSAQISPAVQSSPQTPPSSPQDQQPSPQDQQPSQYRPPGRHQRGQRSGQDDQRHSHSPWDWLFSSWR